MYIKESTQRNKKTGKVYSYYQLVETIRVGNKPIQRVLLQLGKLDLTRYELSLLANLLELKIKGATCILKYPDKIEQIAEAAYFKYQQKEAKEDRKDLTNSNSDINDVKVNLQSVQHEFYRSVGAEIIGLSIWKDINLEKILHYLGFTSKERVHAKAVILGRLISPGSELHTFRWINKHSGLLEYCDTSINHITKDAIYSIGDKLLENKEVIEREVRKGIKSLYPVADKIYLYDLTNTYFESSKKSSNLCKRGKCKNKRYDCPLVTLALVVDQEGFVVLSKIYRGNQSEPTTLSEILSKIFSASDDIRDHLIKPSIVMDRGIATTENLEYLKSNGYSYFVIERKDTVSDYYSEFESGDGFEEHSVSGDEKVYLRKIVDAGTAFILVRSTGKTKKEEAIVDFKKKRFLQDAQRLISSNLNGRIKDENKINVRIGRLKERYQSINNRYKFNLEKEDNNSHIVNKITLMETGKMMSKEEYPGCYVIQTDHTELSPKDIWDFYMSLSEVEASFRSLKSELGTRPVFHQKDSRIESHLNISVLAYSILKTITYRLKQLGYHKRWSEIRKMLSNHMRSTSVFDSNDNIVYHVRATGKPEEDVKEIYNLLKIPIRPFRVIKQNRK